MAALQLALAAACWGFGTVISKQAVAEVAPLALLPIQLACSVALLLVVAASRGIRLPQGHEGRLLGRLGLLNPGLAYALSLLGLTQITASLAVLLWAGEPILILFLAALVLGDRIGLGIVIPSISAIAGLVLVVAGPGAGSSAVGIGLTLAGVGVCATYTVLTRRWLLGTDSTFAVVLAQQLHALGFALLLVLVLFALGQPLFLGPITLGGLLSAAISGVLYYAFAYAFYLSALRRLRASVAAASFYLIPVFGLAGAWLTGERLGSVEWLGAAVVVASVAAITVRGSRADRAVIDEAAPTVAPSPS